MLRKIVAISGKPGLYKVISQGKSMLIVESLTDKKRIPAHASEKVVSLGDISMYTEAGDKPLHEILEEMKALEKGASASIDPKADNNALRAYFATVVPNYDNERVYPTDIRKLIQWYNLLIETGNVDFTAKEAAETTDVEEAAPIATPKAVSKAAPKAVVEKPAETIA